MSDYYSGDEEPAAATAAAAAATAAASSSSKDADLDTSVRLVLQVGEKGNSEMQNHFSFLNKRSILLDSSSYSLSKK